jgi:hypothetical protein
MADSVGLSDLGSGSLTIPAWHGVRATDPAIGGTLSPSSTTKMHHQAQPRFRPVVPVSGASA